MEEAHHPTRIAASNQHPIDEAIHIAHAPRGRSASDESSNCLDNRSCANYHYSCAPERQCLVAQASTKHLDQNTNYVPRQALIQVFHRVCPAPGVAGRLSQRDGSGSDVTSSQDSPRIVFIISCGEHLLQEPPPSPTLTQDSPQMHSRRCLRSCSRHTTP